MDVRSSSCSFYPAAYTKLKKKIPFSQLQYRGSTSKSIRVVQTQSNQPSSTHPLLTCKRKPKPKPKPRINITTPAPPSRQPASHPLAYKSLRQSLSLSNVVSTMQDMKRTNEALLSNPFYKIQKKRPLAGSRLPTEEAKSTLLSDETDILLPRSQTVTYYQIKHYFQKKYGGKRFRNSHQ